ncbi:SDR family oxidoreductase [Herbaspirillum sp. LeCh32-8]|uniref:SDR family oxidoreductase n=1 Tax=Herbaspirillum sp. LeCh32-8 TaxID=2821356 RepID=UPI001AE4DAC5|nr:SDR family oxidoreductase [Herbaspirillum sp. LeCh32-8]MBP0596699.1 SDR family oxidoreductase [Herbaspirillum sp. LeCh32-8]
MADKVIIVTGGSRGIGAATAKLAGQRGYAVAVNYVSNRDAAEAVAADIRKAGARAITVAGDVAKEEDILRLFATVDQELGPVTALINNAGILDHQSRLDAMSAERINRVLIANITGSLLCAREAVKRMSTKHGGKGGTIVNLSSMAAKLGGPGEYVDYAASKGAIDAFTIGLAKEVAAEGIRVNAVRPGLIYTDIHASGGEAGRVDRLKDAVPMKRGGSAEEVANAIMWLVSDESSYATGTFIDVSGGR